MTRDEAGVEPAPWPTPARPATQLRREPGLDGLRGLAVAAVVLYHLALLDALGGLGKVTRGGFLGVSAFFTLSGFLITSLLLLEYRGNDRISFRRFWGRRARRLLPAALVTLAFVALAARWLATPDQLEHLRAEVLSALVYVANWRFILSGSNYAAMFTAQSPVKQLWSLSVEEQWYLVVPLLVAAALRIRRGRRDLLAAVLAAGAIATVALGWFLDHGSYSNRVYLGTDTRFPELAIGALLAIVLTGRGRRARTATEQSDRAPLALNVGSLVVLLGLLVIWATTDLENPWLYRGGLALHAVAVAVLIAAVMRPGTVVNRLFRWKPLTALGRISYAVYLIHWPVILWMTPTRLHVSPTLAACIQAAATISLATISLYCIETPIRSGRVVLEWRRIAVPAVALVVVALLTVAIPRPSNSVITAPLDSSRKIVTRASPPATRPSTTSSTTPSSTPATDAPTTTTTTTPPPPVKVLVIGDSFAASMVPGLNRVALAGGQVAVLDAAIIGCGFGLGGENRGLNIAITYPPTCRQRDSMIMKDLAVFHPDVVVAAGGVWDVSDRLLPGQHSWTHIGLPGYDAYLAGQLGHVADLAQSSGAYLVWLNSPDWNPVYTPSNFMAPGPYAEASTARVDAFNHLLATVLAGRPRAQIIDIASWLKAQPGGQFAKTVRADGVHFTDTETTTAAQWLVPQLVAIVRGTGSG